jgi:galactokinase/mevalonate kinase-like predicted kinase
VFEDRRVPERLLEQYNATIDPLLAAYRRRVIDQCGSLPKRLGGPEREIRYVTPTRDSFPLRRAVKEDQLVWARCPVRLDLAGGWTDTPPYTNRYGGKVVNVAVDLNGEPPIQVYCRPTPERVVRFHSIDLGVTETLTSTKAILDFKNPSSPFALPKAALVLLGVVEDPATTGDAGAGANGSADELSARLDAIGTGVEVTLMCAVPKGSGLGTSSVLGGTILAALARFFGVEMTREELYLNVLAMEQLLTTGGGWQDQVGGIAGSVKYIESVAGMRPRPEVHQLDPFLFADRGYTDRMTLFYTGITRLAKNILQEVVDRVNDYEPAYLFTHRHLAELAGDARRVIALRDYSGLCRIVASSWRGNKLIHESTSNEEIETLLAETSDSYTAVKLLGAGGGGYALFLSESVRDADALRETLATRFDNGRSRLVEFGLNPEGLRVSVS